jgi:predicted signal transduction protein with EAL and GGDEF domain
MTMAQLAELAYWIAVGCYTLFAVILAFLLFCWWVDRKVDRELETELKIVEDEHERFPPNC